MFQIPVNLILSNYEEYQQIRDCAELSINHQKCCMTKALPTITVLYLYEIFYRQNSIKLKLEWRISSLFIWNFSSRTHRAWLLMQFSLLQVSVCRADFEPAITGDIRPGPANHGHLVSGAFQEEPPPVQVLYHSPVTEDLPVPDTLWISRVNIINY